MEGVNLLDFAEFSKARAEALLASTSLTIKEQLEVMVMHALPSFYLGLASDCRMFLVGIGVGIFCFALFLDEWSRKLAFGRLLRFWSRKMALDCTMVKALRMMQSVSKI